MGRRSTVWHRKGRGYWSTVRGAQVFLGHNRQEAKRKLAALLASSAPILPGQFSVRQLVDIFLAECAKRHERNELSAKILEGYRSFLGRWAEACRRVPPERLRVLHLDAWVDSHDAEWNSTTKATAIKRVKTWSRYCVRKGYLDVNRLGDARAPTQLTREPADPQHLLQFERAITCNRFSDYFAILYDTGCRPGELRSIEASSIRWDTSTAVVRGKTGERVIGLTPRALAILKRLAEVYPNGSLLKTVNGCEWTTGNIDHAWRTTRRRAGLPESLVSYHLRHALYVRWHDAGIDELTIAKQLGHVSAGKPHLRLIASTYGHLEGRHLADAARVASVRIGKGKRALS